MKYAFLLSKEDLKLAAEEVLSLFNVKDFRLNGNLLILDLENIESAGRLAYTRKVYQFLFETNINNFIRKIRNFDWNSIYNRDFCVRIHHFRDLKNKNKINSSLKEKNIAEYIWNIAKKPKVNLKNPKTPIEFFIFGNKIFSLKLLKELKHGFESRKAHKRPELHPTGLNPKLSRALINLCGARKGIMDPFCGAGGILLEAGLLGLRSAGYDLYDVMIRKAKVNLDYYKIKNYKLINQDALLIKKKYDYIVTDLPYGLNSAIWVKKGKEIKKIPLKQEDKKQRIKNLEDFYLKFLKNLKKILTRKAVVIFPHYVDYKKLIKKANLKIEKEFSQFVHRSLTRKILVFSGKVLSNRENSNIYFAAGALTKNLENLITTVDNTIE